MMEKKRKKSPISNGCLLKGKEVFSLQNARLSINIFKAEEGRILYVLYSEF